MSIEEISALKERHRKTWTVGDYPDVATFTTALAGPLVEAAEIDAGMDVLDVATGTGNVAIAASSRGATVTGLDLTPRLIEEARGRNHTVEWIVGDAEELPFGDASFDRVLSAIGIQFAPRHEVVTAELVRVCRPGGRIALANWARPGMIGRLFTLMGSYLPAPPAFASPPTLWGDEGHVRSLFAEHGLEPRFIPQTMTMGFPTPEDYTAYFETNYGPTMLAKQVVGTRWPALRADLVKLAEEFHDGTGVVQDYTIAVIDKP